MARILISLVVVLGCLLADGGDINCAAAVPRNAADMLCTAGYRTQAELDNMSGEDKRNTLIVELAKRTSNDVPFYQGQSTDSLVAIGGLYLQLKANGFRTEDEMRGMSAEDLRNTCIVELEKKGYGDIGFLQGRSNFELVEKAADYNGKARGLDEVIDMRFEINAATFSQMKPQVLASGVYDNSGSGQKLFQTFKSTETYTERESLSYSREAMQQINLSIGVNFKMSTLITEVSGSTTFSVTEGTKETMNTATERTTTKTFAIESRVEVDPFKKIKKEFVVNVANVDVPFTMTVRTRTGEIKTIRGTYHGVRAFNEFVTQTNLS